MENLRDICLKNCNVSNEGLKNLNWKRLENINIIGVPIRGMFYVRFNGKQKKYLLIKILLTLFSDLSFIPETATYRTLNWSV